MSIPLKFEGKTCDLYMRTGPCGKLICGTKTMFDKNGMLPR